MPDRAPNSNPKSQAVAPVFPDEKSTDRVIPGMDARDLDHGGIIAVRAWRNPEILGMRPEQTEIRMDSQPERDARYVANIAFRTRDAFRKLGFSSEVFRLEYGH